VSSITIIIIIFKLLCVIISSKEKTEIILSGNDPNSKYIPTSWININGQSIDAR